MPRTTERMTTLATPTPQQAAWQDLEIGMFIHFGPNTWADIQHDDLSVTPEGMNPSKLDTDQWVSVAQSMNAGYIVFVAKHVGGFCMWQTDTTDYSIKSTPWCGGKGDVFGDLAESCRRCGIKLGVYVSPQDRMHGAKVGGKCDTAEAQEAYDDLYRRQLMEALSRYGEMCEVWFDGSTVVEVGDILDRYAPRAMAFQSKHATIRWVGNEEGFAPYPAWNVVSEADARSGKATAEHGAPDGDVWLPLKCDARIRADWFWTTQNASTLKTVDQLMEMYYRSVGHGAVLLLNQTPDTTGLIPEADAQRGAEFGAEISRRFGSPLAETQGQGDILELDLGKAATVDHVVTMEDISQGERVREYAVEGWVEGEWREMCKGASIGHKKIDRFDAITTSKVRLRCTDCAAAPVIRRLAVFSTS